MTIWTATLPTGPADVDHPLNRPHGPHVVHTYAHAPLASNFLQFNTGFSLTCEADNHFRTIFKTPGRALTGYLQASNGLLGAIHYSAKFVHHPTLHNFAGGVGYAAQAVEGAARMAEAELAHPQVTALTGAFAAAVKAANAGPLSTLPYVADWLANVAEYAHGLSKEVAAGMAALHTFTRSTPTRHLAAMQRGTGYALMAISLFKTMGLVQDLDPKHIDSDFYGNDLLKTWELVQGELWAAEIAAAKSPREEEAVAVRMCHAMSEHVGTTRPEALAGLLENAPMFAKKIIEAYPQVALETAAELARTDPQRFAALADKYGASAIAANGAPSSMRS
jgi:hypothetical protein